MADASRTLTAFFDQREDAQEAVERLRQLGLLEDTIRLTGGEAYSGQSDYVEDRGFWASLSDLFFPDADRAAYAEGLRRGGYLVTVAQIPEGMYDRALDILDDEGAVDVDQRAETWRAEGWSGYRAAGTAGAATGTGGTAAGSAAAEEVLPVVEEELRVGKRDVDLGRVRVRSYVVEEPASEQVTLRNERVEVERRPVDRPLSGADAAFTDRTIEAEEHVQEPVVSKEARVKEEIALRRELEERTETVSETVRHTEVEVEDERERGPLGKTAKP
jgi:uncharacterized protein (TIGR02271 family)